MIKHKKFIWLCAIVITLFILANLNSSNVNAQENYSNYLYNQQLNVLDDKAMILTEGANSGNNWRNYFDSGFVFPAKLSTEMFSCYATDWTQYSFNQVYLDNLDNDYAFMSNNESETIQEQITVDKDAFNYSKGSKIGDSYTYYHYLTPNTDIQTEWNIQPTTPTTHYTKIDEYPSQDDSDYIYATTSNPNAKDEFGFTDISTDTYFNFNRIRVYIRYYRTDSSITYAFIVLKDKDGYGIGNFQISLTQTNQWTTANNYISGSWNYTQINEMSIQYQPSYITSGQLRISRTYVRIREQQTSVSVLESESNKISFNSTSILPYTNQTDEYKPVLLTFYYEMCCNVSGIDIFTYLYDFDIEIYKIMSKVSYFKEFILRSFQFNESAQFRLNKFTLNITSSHTSDFLLFIKDFYVNVSYVKINNLGFHDIAITYNRRDNGLTYRGYYEFHVLLYNTCFYYEYLEYNTETDNYYISWRFMNFSDTFDSIETFEIDAHCRYGLNTLDIEITNIFIEIYINSQFYMDFLEQDRKYFSGIHYQTFFNYTCHNRNYLNLTGVFGNYSYNCLQGIRCLSGDDDDIYNRFFVVPLFQENIDVTQPIPEPSDIDIPDEPESPSGYYWTYKSYRIVQGSTIQTSVGNWTIEFTQIDAEQYDAKFFYNPQSIDKRSFGSWVIKIGDARVWFNWLRDGIVFIINLVLLFLQYLLFLVVASLSFVFMFLGCYILVILYNICVYYIYIGLCYVLWYIVLAFNYLWQLLVWVWNNLLIPFLEWCYNVLLPWVLEGIIIIMAFLITCFVYVLTLGTIDFWSTYNMIYEVLWLIVDFIIEFVMVYANNVEYFFLFILWYFLNAGLIYLRYLYSRARGNINRAKQLYYTFQIYIAPIVFIWNLLKKLLESTPEV